MRQDFTRLFKAGGGPRSGFPRVLAAAACAMVAPREALVGGRQGRGDGRAGGL